MKVRQGGKIIGDIESRVLVKKGKQVVLFKKYNGFAFSIATLGLFDTVYIHYGGNVYRATRMQIEHNGIPHSYGYDTQLVLPLSYFEIVSDKQSRLL